MIAHVLNGVINKPVRDALLIDHALREFSSKEAALSSSDEVNEPRYELLISRLVRLHWDWAHMLRVKESYYARYQRSMEEDIKNATEGDFNAFCLSLVESRSKENPVDDNATGSTLEPYQLADHARSQKEQVPKTDSTPFAPEDGTVISGIKETGDQLAAKNADNGASTVGAEQQPILPDKPPETIDVTPKRRQQLSVSDSDNSPAKPRSHEDISGVTLEEYETVHHGVEAPQLDDGATTSEASGGRTSRRTSPIIRLNDLGDEYYSYTDVAGKRSARGFDIIDKGGARSINYGAYRDTDLYAVLRDYLLFAAAILF